MIENSNYKRITKNTVVLYFRFFLVLLVSLYSSRVALKVLGFEDFGTYNVVGGFVTLLSFLNNYLSKGTSRFITFYLGLKNEKSLRDVFSASLALHLFLAVLIFFVGESFGLWYVKNYLNLEIGRESVAIFVFHLSLITCCLGIIQSLFSSCITAHEDMSFFAYISLFEVLMKLVIVFMLLYVNIDKLKLYSFLFFLVSLITMFSYIFFCLKKYKECSIKIKIDIKLYKRLFNYMGWNAIGSVAFTLNWQGITLLLNSFFGVVVNAARGVAGALSNVVNQFVFSFQTAMRPQIVKSYAKGNVKEMERLIFYSSQFSSFLCMLFGLPLFIESDTVLLLWLGNVPPYASFFVRITVIQIMVQGIDFPLGDGIQAIGKMKLPNLTSSLVYLSVLPLSYLALIIWNSPIVVYIASLSAYPIALLFDLWILAKYVNFNYNSFMKNIVLKTILLLIICGFVPMLVHLQMDISLFRLFVVGFICLIITVPVIYYKGLDIHTRMLVVSTIRSKFNRIKLNQ